MRKLKNTIIITVFAFCISGFAGERYRTRWGTDIIFSKISGKYYEQRAFLENADRVCSVLFRARDDISANPDGLKCRIVVMNPDMRKKLKIPFKVMVLHSTVTIYVDNDFASWRDSPKYFRQFISALVMTKCSVNPRGRLDSIPFWLIAGIDADMRSRRRTVKTFDYQPGLRAVAVAKKIPPLKQLISKPVSIDDGGNVYEYYSSLCRFLLFECYKASSLTDNAMADMIILSASKNYSSEEVFASSITRTILKNNRCLFNRRRFANFDDAAKLQYWFAMALRKKNINSFSPLNSTVTAERFALINSRVYEVRTSHNTWKKQRLNLAALPKLWDRIKDPLETAKGLRSMVTQLRLEAPVLCVEPLFKLENALVALNIKSYFDDSKTQRLMTEALRNFDHALERQRKTEKYLFSKEYALVSASVLFSRDLKIVDASQSGWKSLDAFLDKVEADFLEK